MRYRVSSVCCAVPNDQPSLDDVQVFPDYDAADAETVYAGWLATPRTRLVVLRRVTAARSPLQENLSRNRP